MLETSCRIGLCLCIMSAGRAERQIFRLHLGNLSPTISIDDIESRFRFGEVQEVNILLDKFPWKDDSHNAAVSPMYRCTLHLPLLNNVGLHSMVATGKVGN